MASKLELAAADFAARLAEEREPRSVLARTAEFVTELSACQRVFAYWKSPDLLLSYETKLRSANDFGRRLGLGLSDDVLLLADQPLVGKLIMAEAAAATDLWAAALERLGAVAVLVVRLDAKDGGGWLECHYYDRTPGLDDKERSVLQEVAAQCAAVLGKQPTVASPQPERPEAERLPGVIIDVNSDGLIEYVSEQLELLTGRRAEQVLGRPILDFLSGLLLEVYRFEALRSVKRVLSGQQPRCDFFAEALSRGGSRHFLIQAESTGSEPRRMVLLLSDVSASNFYRERLGEAELRSRRLAEYGNLIIVRTDPEFNITEVLGDMEGIVGISARELRQHNRIWRRLLSPADLVRLQRRIAAMGSQPGKISGDLRVRNLKTRRWHWLLVNAVPLFSSSEVFQGWECFAFDITEKRQTELALQRHTKQLAALLAVSSALLGSADPAVVALQGLKAIIDATNAAGGFAVFCEPNSDYLEVVAAAGLSLEYLSTVSEFIFKHQSLLHQTIRAQRSRVIFDLQGDPQAAIAAAKQEGLRSAMLVPLIYDEPRSVRRVLGAVVVFCRKLRRFSAGDVELADAVCNQIALVVRQAESSAAEKRQANSLAALYRLSHELAKVSGSRDVAAHAFPIIQEVLACRRMWLGVINEQGTHLIGQGGSGPGLRRQVIELQIELDRPHEFLDEALTMKEPVIVLPDQEMQCSGLNRLLARLKPGPFVIVPLNALGRVVGVLILEPAAGAAAAIERRLGLLSSMGSEIGTVILTRRFESKMADAEKMRMAGVLSSGVAHNFNNLLQAIMGQASLIEMQAPGSSPVVAAARTIIETSARGATLIRQLLSLTQTVGATREVFAMGDLLQESQDLYQSLLDNNIGLEYSLATDLPPVEANYGQLQQVLTNLVMNARDAIGGREGGLVRITAAVLRLRSGEVDPELAPGWYARIDVTDNGVGMDDERRARCFEPFFTTKNVDAGTGISLTGSGLGLALCYSIVRQHEGVMTVQSSIGSGATFSIYLPALRPAAGEEIRGYPGEPDMEGKGDLRAVVLESSGGLHHAVRLTLESLGFKIEIRSSGAQVLQDLKEDSQPVDLLILDFDRMEAEELPLWLAEIKQQRPDIRVLGVSMQRALWLQRLRSAGIKGVDLMDKPLGVWATHAVARKILHMRRRMGLAAQVEQLPNGSNGQSCETVQGAVRETVVETVPVTVTEGNADEKELG